MQFRPISVILVGLIVLATLGIGGCSSGEEHSEHTSMLPEFAKDAPVTVQQAYQFAIEHPDILANHPCYCGCGAMGHLSNLNCYIREVNDDGTIVFDTHALGCGICVDIAQDVMRLTDQGMSQPDIRAYIDGKYSAFGPPTDTPFPQA
jgi:hypothetical protein